MNRTFGQLGVQPDSRRASQAGQPAGCPAGEADTGRISARADMSAELLCLPKAMSALIR